MNGYIALYKEERVELEAKTTLAAQQEATRRFQAMPKFKRRKVAGSDVSVYLAEKDGETVTHAPDF